MSTPVSCKAARRAGSARLLHVLLALTSLLPFFTFASSRGTAAGASFFDDFKTFDEKRWFVSDGWANGDYQDCIWSSKHVRASANKIELVLSDDPAKDRRYTCAEVKTRELFGYGTYEVRMRAAAGPGIVTAFFTYTGPPANPHDEIDFEFLGKAPRAVQLNYYANGIGKHERIIKFDFDASTEIHDYAFEWKPDTIRWFVDGKLVHSVAKHDREPFPRHPGYIHLILWNGVGAGTEAWLERFQYPGHPVTAAVEHIAFTKSGEPCQFPVSIVCNPTTDYSPKR